MTLEKNEFRKLYLFQQSFHSKLLESAKHLEVVRTKISDLSLKKSIKEISRTKKQKLQ